MSDALMPTYNRLPVTFERGVGAWLWDTNGKKYLDALSSIAVCGLGHAHPAVTQAICQQSEKLTHVSNLYMIAQQEKLAAELARVSSMNKAFFCNSGAEANETAIKLARLYGHKKNIANPIIIVAENSFHGRTLATLSATGSRKVQAGFEPLVQGFIRVSFDDIYALQTVAKNNSDIVAVLLEPIQGESGINIPASDYLNQVRQLCDQNNWLMMLDEVQTGMCRTGQWFAYQHSGVLPDVVTVAKGLGNGFPIGACLARGYAADVFQPGNHGSTFGGTPLACSAALAVIQTLEKDSLAKRAAELGERMLKQLKDALAGQDQVKAIRGLGLMIGIELDNSCTELVLKGLEQGILFSVQSDKVIRLLPPLIISDDEADKIVTDISEIVKNFAG